MVSLIYQIVASTFLSGPIAYFHTSCPEVTLLMDHCSNLVVDLIYIPVGTNNGFEKIPIVKFRTSDLCYTFEDSNRIRISSSKWSGTITTCVIRGANYIIYQHDRVFIKSNSNLGNDIQTYYIQGHLQKIGEVMFLLSQADAGFIDEEIRHYIV